MFVFDSIKGTLDFGNEVIFLTGREIEIFEILNKNKNKCTSLGTFAEEIYGEDTERYREDIRILMWRMKKKIGHKIKIRTFYGKGYVLIEV